MEEGRLLFILEMIPSGLLRLHLACEFWLGLCSMRVTFFNRRGSGGTAENK